MLPAILAIAKNSVSEIVEVSLVAMEVAKQAIGLEVVMTWRMDQMN